jgi:hypothetical protein
VQVAAEDETAARLFRSLGFVQVDEGVSYVKTKDAAPAPAPAE